ncbi:hypothetical protein EAH_00067310, partial [Eimeria acervulina]
MQCQALHDGEPVKDPIAVCIIFCRFCYDIPCLPVQLAFEKKNYAPLFRQKAGLSLGARKMRGIRFKQRRIPEDPLAVSTWLRADETGTSEPIDVSAGSPPSTSAEAADLVQTGSIAWGAVNGQLSMPSHAAGDLWENREEGSSEKQQPTTGPSTPQNILPGSAVDVADPLVFTEASFAATEVQSVVAAAPQVVVAAGAPQVVTVAAAPQLVVAPIAPQLVAAAAPQPAVAAGPQPVAAITVQLVAAAAPQPVAAAGPQLVAAAGPQPVAAVAVQLVAAAAPQPVAVTGPQPVAAAAPQLVNATVVPQSVALAAPRKREAYQKKKKRPSRLSAGTSSVAPAKK